MAIDAVKNFAYTIVAGTPPGLNSEIITVADISVFPEIGVTGGFNVVVCPTKVKPTVANAEILRVNLIDGSDLHVSREQEGTNRRNILVGDQIFQSLTAKTLADLEIAVSPVNWSNVEPPNSNFRFKDGLIQIWDPDLGGGSWVALTCNNGILGVSGPIA